MQIRRATATATDIATLVKLNATVQILHAQARPDIFKMPGDDVAMAEVYAVLMDNPDTVIYFAEVDGVAVGYVVAQIQHRLENPFSFGRDQISLDQISVEPEHQGKGYGKALTQAVLDLAEAEGIVRVTLGVWAFNAAAIGFYEKLGFKMQMHRMEFLQD